MLKILFIVCIVIIVIIMYIKVVVQKYKYTIKIITDYRSYVKEIITSKQYDNVVDILKEGHWIKEVRQYYIIKEHKDICIPIEKVQEIVFIKEKDDSR